jgi:hypothetical protein
MQFFANLSCILTVWLLQEFTLSRSFGMFGLVLK